MFNWFLHAIAAFLAGLLIYLTLSLAYQLIT